MRKIHKRLIAAAGVAALGVAGITVAANAAGGTGCRTLTYPLCARSVAKTQVVDHSLDEQEFAPSVLAKLNKVGTTGPQGPAGPAGAAGKDGAAGAPGKDGAPGLSNLEADGPYPGSTDLGKLKDQGDNSDELVPADNKSHAVWVQCAPGKVALGGGFRLGADQGDAVASKIQVTASEPTQVADGKLVNVPIEGDEAQSIQPNGWLVEVINNSNAAATVRPWVTCATVAK